MNIQTRYAVSCHKCNGFLKGCIHIPKLKPLIETTTNGQKLHNGYSCEFLER